MTDAEKADLEKKELEKNADTGPNMYDALNIKKPDASAAPDDAAKKLEQEKSEKEKAEKEKHDKEEKEKAEKEKNSGSGAGDNLNEEQIKAKKEKEDQEKLEKEKAEKEKAEKEKKTTTEVTDELVLEYLKKQGIDVKSVADLRKPLSAEEIEKQKEQREAAMLSFGLEKNLFSKKDYETYTQLSADPRKVVFNKFKASMEAQGEKDAEKIEASFKEYFFEDLDENDTKRKLRAEEMKEMAEQLLHKQFPKIVNLQNEFEAHEKVETEKTEFNKQVTAKATDYKKIVENVTSSIEDIEADINDELLKTGELKYKFKFPEESVQNIKDGFLDKETFKSYIAQGFTEDQIKKAVRDALILENLPKIISHVSKAYGTHLLQESAKGRRGIIEGQEGAGAGAAGVKDEFLTEALKGYIPAGAKAETQKV